MNWSWPFIAIAIFYFAAILQNSFFIYFGFFGGCLNLIFILFFSCVFFCTRNNYFKIAFFALMAGFLLDVFSVSKIGLSIGILVLLGFAINKIQFQLKQKEDKYPLSYFIVIFVVSFAAYNSLFWWLSGNGNVFDWNFLWQIIYNLLVAVLVFLIAKKFAGKNNKASKFL